MPIRILWSPASGGAEAGAQGRHVPSAIKAPRMKIDFRKQPANPFLTKHRSQLSKFC
jgi:hypothetical protein